MSSSAEAADAEINASVPVGAEINADTFVLEDEDLETKAAAILEALSQPYLNVIINELMTRISSHTRDEGLLFDALQQARAEIARMQEIEASRPDYAQAIATISEEVRAVSAENQSLRQQLEETNKTIGIMRAHDTESESAYYAVVQDNNGLSEKLRARDTEVHDLKVQLKALAGASSSPNGHDASENTRNSSVETPAKQGKKPYGELEEELAFLKLNFVRSKAQFQSSLEAALRTQGKALRGRIQEEREDAGEASSQTADELKKVRTALDNSERERSRLQKEMIVLKRPLEAAQKKTESTSPQQKPRPVPTSLRDSLLTLETVREILANKSPSPTRSQPSSPMSLTALPPLALDAGGPLPKSSSGEERAARARREAEALRASGVDSLWAAELDALRAENQYLKTQLSIKRSNETLDALALKHAEQARELQELEEMAASALQRSRARKGTPGRSD